MHRSRITTSFAGLGVALLAAPMLATAVLAADPTVLVKAGDTLTSLAKRHGVEIATLVELNAIADPNRIYVGQRFQISPPPPVAPAVTAAAARSHVVASGEHLTGIARRFGVTIAAIVDANDLADPSRIFTGQRLAIPGGPATSPAPPPAAPAVPAAAPRSHVVASGEHLTGIARRFGVTIAAIVDANDLADPSRIFTGQRLAIPARPATPTMSAEMAALVAERDAIRRVIVEEADRFSVPAALALAVAWQESGWRQGAVSHAGAVGVMQLMPATADWVGDAMLGTPVAIDDTRQNIRAGVRLLAHYLDRYDADRARVLAAYYQGQWATDHHGIYAVSKPYIASVKALEAMFAR